MAKTPRSELWLTKLKDHPVIACFVVLGALVVGIGGFLGGLDSIITFVQTRITSTETERPPIGTTINNVVISPSPTYLPQCFQPDPSGGGGSDQPLVGPDDTLYRRFHITRSKGGTLESCSAGQCVVIDVGAVEGTEGKPFLQVAVRLPPLSAFPKMARFKLGDMPVRQGAVAAVRTADFDFEAEIEQVAFESLEIGTRLSKGSNIESLARLEVDNRWADLFGDWKKQLIWVRAKGPGTVAVACEAPQRQP